ncbi:MAG: hypothetical protein AAGD01_14945 [Acidobacteriota bacterium]
MSENKKPHYLEWLPNWIQAGGVAIGAFLLATLQHQQADHHKKLEVSGQLFPLAVEVLKAPPSASNDGLRNWAVGVVTDLSVSLDHEVSDELIQQLKEEPLPPLILQTIQLDAQCSLPRTNPTLCQPETAKITTETEGQLWILIQPNEDVCQPVRYTIQIDESTVIFSDWYEPGSTSIRRPIEIKGLNRGTHTLSFMAESRPGGCSGDGSIDSLSATVHITVST